MPEDLRRIAPSRGRTARALCRIILDMAELIGPPDSRLPEQAHRRGGTQRQPDADCPNAPPTDLQIDEPEASRLVPRPSILGALNMVVLTVAPLPHPKHIKPFERAIARLEGVRQARFVRLARGGVLTLRVDVASGQRLARVLPSLPGYRLAVRSVSPAAVDATWLGDRPSDQPPTPTVPPGPGEPPDPQPSLVPRRGPTPSLTSAAEVELPQAAPELVDARGQALDERRPDPPRLPV
jgi:hypothetical protein